MSEKQKLDYKDIPKYVSSGKYHVDIPLMELGRYIHRHETEYGLQLNPDFQRGHVWTEEQQIKFVEHVLKSKDNVSNSIPILFNHPGWMRSFEGDYVCVDGLQRLTAMIKFVNNEIPVFGGYYFKDITNIPGFGLTVSIYINDLRTRAEVLQWYIELNSGGTVHTEDEITKVKKLLELERV